MRSIDKSNPLSHYLDQGSDSMPAKSSGGQYSPRHNSKPRHSAIGRSCDRHDYRLSLSAERKQRDYSNRFGRYRLSERFVAYRLEPHGELRIRHQHCFAGQHYQIIARNPATAPSLAGLLSGPANPGMGYTTGNYLFIDWTATKKFGKWEIGPVGFFKFQTTSDSPGGINPATGSAWTCAQLTAAKLPTCGKDTNIGVGLLVGYDFGPVDMKFIYSNGFYSSDAIDAPTGSTFFIKTSFRLWSPDDPPKNGLIAKN
jgi:Putative MetA-pathway of phenol degradation